MNITQDAFVLAKGAIHIRFVSGNDGLAPIPEAVARAGLSCRFAVVQDSFVNGYGEMYYDEQLWLCLLAFAKTYGAELRIVGLGPKREYDELPVDEFLRSLKSPNPGSDSPPWAILASEGGALKIGIVTDYWADAGGPQPYSDSYTYSIYSEREVAEEVLTHLRAANSSGRWSLDLPVIQVPANKVRLPSIAPGKLTRFLSKLRKPREKKALPNV